MCVQVHVNMHAHVCRGPTLRLDAFLSYSLLLRQGLSPNLKLADSACLAGQLGVGIPCLCLWNAGTTGGCLAFLWRWGSKLWSSCLYVSLSSMSLLSSSVLVFDVGFLTGLELAKQSRLADLRAPVPQGSVCLYFLSTGFTTCLLHMSSGDQTCLLLLTIQTMARWEVEAGGFLR